MFPGKHVIWLLLVAPALCAGELPRRYTETVTNAFGDKASFDMVLIPGGRFTMGSPQAEEGREEDEGPQHEVELPPFYLATTETTYELFGLYARETLGQRRWVTVANNLNLARVYAIDAVTGPTEIGYPYSPPHSTPRYTPQHPITYLTWEGAVEICRWLRGKTGRPYRLPSEAEWEYACRAGSTTSYSFGAAPEKAGDYAWFDESTEDDDRYDVQATAQKKPNAWGLYDMHGNVLEWCHDYYDPRVYARRKAAGPKHERFGPDRSPLPALDATYRRTFPHVARGGSCWSSVEETRSATRDFETAGWRENDPQEPKHWIWLHKMPTGFRLACDVPAATGWRQFRGPWRSGVSRETGLLRTWPEGGPPLLWTADGIGSGFASVSVAGGRLYTAGDIGQQEFVFCLDPDGDILWKTPNGKAWRQGRLSGARGTPTADGDRAYHENAHGDLVCLDAATGKRIWGFNILGRFRGKKIRWGLAEAPLIDGDRVICCPGGLDASVAALDKHTGQVVWTCPTTYENAGYASPVLVEQRGHRQIVAMTAHSAIGVHADTGRLLWRFEHGNDRGTNCPSPVVGNNPEFIRDERGWHMVRYHNRDRLFLNSGAGTGGVMLKLHIDRDGAWTGVEELWRTDDLDNHHGGIVVVGSYLYGAADKAHRSAWVCLDSRDGELRYTEKGVGKGSVVVADGMLYTLSEKGVMGLVPVTPRKHDVVSQFAIPKGGRGPVWAHPVVCGRRLYIRHDDRLFAYDIAAR